ncbi:hypothetical protein F2P81_024763 [Scophthalmus maximus]|uniref:Uncharacterized protein n=1 Tax=Scophthalmus maximus TaxID=52904 RepID=A0A6A4RUQ7_SCOMX|nr:hypothetical protein F2P81_024763 [Scophthalmus maximus]
MNTYLLMMKMTCPPLPLICPAARAWTHNHEPTSVMEKKKEKSQRHEQTEAAAPSQSLVFELTSCSDSNMSGKKREEENSVIMM